MRLMRSCESLNAISTAKSGFTCGSWRSPHIKMCARLATLSAKETCIPGQIANQAKGVPLSGEQSHSRLVQEMIFVFLIGQVCDRQHGTAFAIATPPQARLILVGFRAIRERQTLYCYDRH